MSASRRRSSGPAPVPPPIPPLRSPRLVTRLDPPPAAAPAAAPVTAAPSVSAAASQSIATLHTGSAKKSTRSTHGDEQFLAAAKAVAKKGPTGKIKTESNRTTGEKCMECQTVMVYQGGMKICPNTACYACPNITLPTRRSIPVTPIRFVPFTQSIATTTSTKKKRKPTVVESASEEEEEEHEAEEDSSASDASEADKSDSASPPKKRPRGRPPKVDGDASKAKTPVRKAKPTRLVDPDDMTDDDADESYVGPKSASKTKGAKKSMMSSSKFSSRDTDLARALALSREAATPADLEHMSSIDAGLSARDASKAVSIWDEVPNDPRHLNTLVTGVYTVHQTATMPNGYVDNRPDTNTNNTTTTTITDEGEGTTVPAGTSPAKAKRLSIGGPPVLTSPTITSTPAPLPVLLRSGFTSLSSTESSSSLFERSSISSLLSSRLERCLRHEVTRGESEVFNSIETFLTHAFRDFGSKTIQDGNKEIRQAGREEGFIVQTDFVHQLLAETNKSTSTAASGDSPHPYIDHCIPFALVHAGSDVSDHPLLMRGFIDHVRRGAHLRRRARRSIGAVERRRLKLQKAELEKSTPSKQKSHNYRGLGESRKLEIDGTGTGVGVDSDIGSSDSDVDPTVEDGGVSNVFPTPAPFVALLSTSTSTNLFGLLKSLYVSLVDAYPSPLSARTHSSRSSEVGSTMVGVVGGGLSKRQLEKSHPEGGLEYVIQKLSEWCKEWIQDGKNRYYTWHKKRIAETTQQQQQQRAAASQDNSDSMMDIDDAAKNTHSASKRGTKRKHTAATTTTASAASSASFAPAPPLPHVYDVSATSSPIDFLYPGSIYPSLILLLPSFECCSPHLLDELLNLFLNHPLLRHLRLNLPISIVCPHAGPRTHVLEEIPKVTRERLWIRNFQLIGAEQVWERVIEAGLRGTDVSGGIATSSLWPFQLGSDAMRQLRNIFHTSSSSIGRLIKVLRYIVLDLCDGGEAKCELTAGYLRARSNQLRRIARTNQPSSSSMAARRAASKDNDDDPIAAWIASLSSIQLSHLRRLPSLAHLKVAESDVEFRHQVEGWLNDSHVHRMGFALGVRVLHKVLQTAGFAMAGGGGGVSSEFELWSHLLSNTLFDETFDGKLKPPPSASASAAATPFATAATTLARFERPEALKNCMELELKHALAAIRSARATVAASLDGPDRVDHLWLTRLEQRWSSQLQQLQAGSSGASSASLASVAPPAVASGGAGALRRDRLLQTAHASAHGAKLASASVLGTIHAFTLEMLKPMCRMPLAELMCVESGRKIRYLFQPQTEAAIYTALTQSEYYLGPKNGTPASSSSSSSSSSPFVVDLLVPPVRPSGGSSSLSVPAPSDDDLVVAFGIFSSMNGIFVNLADWFQAFKNVMRQEQQQEGIEEEEEKKKENNTRNTVTAAKKTRSHASSLSLSAARVASSSSASTSPAAAVAFDSLSDSALQVRFLSCLSTLANLGYLTATRRRVDHVLKLTMHKPI